ncbi:hypothetical protein D3C73_925550 [compost metagenome]
MPVPRATRIHLARHEHDVLRQSALEQFTGVHTRQLQPQQEASLRLGGAGAGREMFGDQLPQATDLLAVQPAHAMQVVLVTAGFQVGGHRITEQLRFAAGGLEFEQRDALGEASAIEPADPVVRCQRLRKATDHHHPAIAVERLQQGRRRLAELQFGVHRIFDQRQLACVDQLGQALLVGDRHRAAQRVVYGRHHHQRRQRCVLQQCVQRIHVQAALRMGGQFDRLQAERGQQGIQVEVRGRFDADGITGLGDRAQGQLQRLHRAMGQQQALGMGMQAQPGPTPHDLRQQALRTVGAGIGFHGLLAMSQHLCGMPCQLRTRVELSSAWAGKGQVDHAGAALCFQHARHQHLL